MMTREQLMLTKLAEEAAEVAQISLKAQQFGLDEVCPGQPLSNRQRLHKELDDLNGVLSELNAKHGLDYVPSTQAIADKRAKMAHYADYAQSLGRVEGQPDARAVPLTDEQIMKFMAPWRVQGDPEDRADLIRSVRAMLTEAGVAIAPQGVSI